MSEAAIIPSISQIVAPVIMISACGILCSTLYGRLVAVVQRLRDFQRERLKEIERFGALPVEERETGVSAVARIWLDELNSHIPRLLFRAKVTTVALVFFLLCILTMILCSLVLAFSVLLPEIELHDQVPVTLFVIGATSMIIGVCICIVELILAVAPLTSQHQFINKVQDIEIGWLVQSNVLEKYSDKAPMLSPRERISHSIELNRMSI